MGSFQRPSARHPLHRDERRLLDLRPFLRGLPPSLQSTTFQDIAPEGTVVVQDWGPYLSIFIYLPSGWGGQKISGTLAGTSVTWEYDIDNRFLTLGGEGSVPDFITEKSPWWNLPVRQIVIGWGIDAIGDGEVDIQDINILVNMALER